MFPASPPRFTRPSFLAVQLPDLLPKRSIGRHDSAPVFEAGEVPSDATPCETGGNVNGCVALCIPIQHGSSVYDGIIREDWSSVPFVSPWSRISCREGSRNSRPRTSGRASAGVACRCSALGFGSLPP
jgi:hypothetical protein